MKNITIKAKLVILFILIKVIPLLIIVLLAYEGVKELENYVNKSTQVLFDENKEIIFNTANASIEDSIKNLDKKSQESLEKVSFEIANNIASFLYERDNDILFLSKLNLNQAILEEFNASKKSNVLVHPKYEYNETTNKYERVSQAQAVEREVKSALLKDNEREFNYTDPLSFKTQSLPLYKEISFIDLKGNEQIKVSSINSKKLNVFNPLNTYVKAENYRDEIVKLTKGEIYVSDVIGEYVGTKVIGTFTKEKAQKASIAFEPEKYAYAGVENPLGKRFEGIVRFITPVFKNGLKIGYISMALDHKHLREFTDTTNPTGIYPKQDISDASLGNYAFMWDYEGKNISHPRDYSIVGYDKNSGKRVMPWLSADIAEKFYASNEEINQFLSTYPIFYEQGLNKKPNLKQLKEEGLVGLDCRYLNFAPQCQGWMQLTEHGGYGSFIINWSNVWKLTTAAAIPYYTGKYKNSPRGFGFVAIGANIDEFHAAANETKKNVDLILETQTSNMKSVVDENKFQIGLFIKSLINELSVVTFIMVILVIAIAIWMSNYILSKIDNLLIGTKKFANNELDYRIEVKTNDEIGNLERSFNQMASEINALIQKQKELNEHLGDKVEEKTKELININHNLELVIEQRTKDLKESLLKAENAHKVKSTFLANMSHEIRTPLNAIIGFSELLSHHTGLDNESKKQSKIIEQSAKSLLNIINDILDISKIESGNFDVAIVPINLDEICLNVYELFEQKAQDKQIALEYNFDAQIPHCVLSDGIRIRQVLTNLIGNAIKFTPEKEKVKFSTLLLKNENNSVVVKFIVQDTGIGIEEDAINRVFEPFVQIDNKSNRKYEGTGLGLSISAHIIESLNSKIKINSKLNEGSCFEFDLTFEKCNENKEILTVKKEKKERCQITFKGSVLIAEDNILNQELMKYLLEKLGLKYNVVSNGQEAVEAYKNSSYDVVLMDINMPILDGIEATKQILEYEKENGLEHTPICALTANAIKGDEEKFLSLGMDYYLSKPLHIDSLKMMLNSFLKEKSEKEVIVADIKNDKSFNISKEDAIVYKKQDAMEQLGLDELTVDMLLDNFFLTLESDLKKLQEAIDEKNSEKISQAAHYLKGACANFAMIEATNILENIESRANNSETDFNLFELKQILEKIKKSI